MKTKELDCQQLGQKEDWLGNNAALECPACGKVYIVSSFLKNERTCPGCGKSRARITGSKGRNGKAIITWDYAPNFTIGKKYSRKEISAALGGSEVEYLPTENKSVVCGCFTLEHNPEAPDIVIPGTGKVIEREAKQFCEQNYPVPIFIKRRVNEWEYVGDYKAVNHSTAATDIAANHKGSITPLKEVTRVIFMKRAPDEDQKGKCA
jgi:ribosomal protein S27E